MGGNSAVQAAPSLTAGSLVSRPLMSMQLLPQTLRCFRERAESGVQLWMGLLYDL